MKNDPVRIPKIAIVGRIGVGKTALCQYLTEDSMTFIPYGGMNRGTNKSIYYGTKFKYENNEFSYVIIDTPGFVSENQEDKPYYVELTQAIAQADILILLASDTMVEDSEIMRAYRRIIEEQKEKPIYMAVNSYSPEYTQESADRIKTELGYQRIYIINPLEGTGITELFTDIMTAIEKSKKAQLASQGIMQLALQKNNSKSPVNDNNNNNNNQVQPLTENANLLRVRSQNYTEKL